MHHIGRKLYHLLGGLVLLSLYYILGRERAFVVYAVLVVVALTLDIVRLTIPAVNRFVFAHFSSFVRKNEEQKLTGTAPYILGIGLSLSLYSKEAATAAICFLAFGDVAATTIGERYGRTKIGSKSLEGTAAFVAAALGAGFILMFLGMRIEVGVLVLGALAAAGAELLTLRLNDNLLIPLVSGGVMHLAMGWLK